MKYKVKSNQRISIALHWCLIDNFRNVEYSDGCFIISTDCSKQTTVFLLTNTTYDITFERIS